MSTPRDTSQLRPDVASGDSAGPVGDSVTGSGGDSVTGSAGAGGPAPRGGLGRGGAGHGGIGRARAVARAVLPVLGTLVVFLAIWLAVSYLLLTPQRREILVPPPQEVLTDSVLQWSHLQPMLRALLLDVEVSALGLLIAATLGVLSAIVMSQAGWLERGLYPFAIMLQTVPILAIVPLIGLWFDYGLGGRVVVCVIIAMFPMITNTLFGIHSADQGAHDLFTLHKASRWQRLRKLQLPAALPALFTGLRISAGLSVVGALVGDFFFVQGQPGLGTLLSVYISRVNSTDLFAAIGLSSLYGIAVFVLFTVLGQLVVGSWYGPGRAGR